MGRSPKQGGAESEYHTVAIRLRVVGNGNLQLALTDLGKVVGLDVIPTQTQNLVPVVMQTSTRIEPMRLTNFQSQRTRLEGKVTAIDETFIISKIILFAKAVAVEYPS